MKNEQGKRNVSLPAELYGRIEARVKVAEFSSVDEYVIFILEEVLKGEGEKPEAIFTKEAEEEMKKRLKALGYLDD